MQKFISFVVLFLAVPAFAGGGWVGNSPVEVAYQPPSIGPEATMSSDSPSEEEPEWNSLLLPKHQKRLDLDFKNHSAVGADNFGFGLDYGITDRLTIFSGTVMGYSLLSGNGRGSEVALYFGMLDGFYYGTYTGLYAFPGVGLGYAYSTSKWRTTWRESLTTLLWAQEFRGVRSTTTGDFTYWLTSKWGLGVSATYDAWLDTPYHSGWSSQSVFAVYQASKQWQITALYDRYQGAGAGIAFTW